MMMMMLLRGEEFLKNKIESKANREKKREIEKVVIGIKIFLVVQITNNHLRQLKKLSRKLRKLKD
jgi:hypothetical protein